MQSAFTNATICNVVVIGEVLFDIIHGIRHLGGAPFNCAAHLTKLGHHPHFVSAVFDDTNGRDALRAMDKLGMATRYVRKIEGFGNPDAYPTGTVSVTLDASGQPSYVVHRLAAYDFPAIAEEDFTELVKQKPEYIYFGTLQHMSATARALTSKILDAVPRAHRFYDVNLRNECYTPELVRDLLSRSDIVKLNEDEAAEVQSMLGEPESSVEAFCHAFTHRFGWQAVCVTLGSKGCALLTAGEYVEAPGYPIKVADTVGAGDAFSAALLHGIALGMPSSAIADFANRVGALVASRSGAVPEWTIEDALRLSR